MTTANGGYLALDDRSIDSSISGLSIEDAAGKMLVKVPAGGSATFKGGDHVQRGLTPTFFFSPDGRTLVVQEKWGTGAVLYDIPSGKERCAWRFRLLTRSGASPRPRSSSRRTVSGSRSIRIQQPGR